MGETAVYGGVEGGGTHSTVMIFDKVNIWLTSQTIAPQDAHCPYTYYMYSNLLAFTSIERSYSKWLSYVPKKDLNEILIHKLSSLKCFKLPSISRRQVAKEMKKISRQLNSGREEAGWGWRTFDKLVSGTFSTSISYFYLGIWSFWYEVLTLGTITPYTIYMMWHLF